MKDFKKSDLKNRIDEMRRVNSCNKIWERQEAKEVTMAELEKMFGCKVKIVKEE